MAKTPLILFLAFSIFLQGTFGELVCEELHIGMCSFSISSAGNRCSLETTTYGSRDGSMKYQCKTSGVIVNNIREHIESDECIEACGLDRNSVGISSDNLLDPQFSSLICSPRCSQNCPNIADLYHNLAGAEGVNLRELCKALSISPRRALSKLLSSGAASGPGSAAAAEGPISSGVPVGAPTPLPVI